MWTGATAKNTMQVGSYIVESTIGFNPMSETATFQWLLEPEEMASLKAILKAGKFNDEYTYLDTYVGTVNVRPTGSYFWSEVSEERKVRFNATFRVL